MPFGEGNAEGRKLHEKEGKIFRAAEEIFGGGPGKGRRVGGRLNRIKCCALFSMINDTVELVSQIPFSNFTVSMHS